MQTVEQKDSLQTKKNNHRKYRCNKCKDTGYVYDPETNTAKICECMKKRIVEKRLRFAKVPSQFKELTVRGFKTDYYSKAERDEGLGMTHFELAKRAKTIAVNYVENFAEMQKDGMGLYFYYWDPGTGKTHLAVAILNALIKKYGVAGVYMVTGDLIEEIKRLMFEGDKHSDEDGNTLSQTLESVKNIDVLLLDDIGVEKTSDFVKNTLYNILNDRYINKKPTLFTSNCSIEELQHGERIQSRIQAMVYPVYLPGEDIRLKLAEKMEDDKYKKLLEG
jgi:DNA replication protein DnaC